MAPRHHQGSLRNFVASAADCDESPIRLQARFPKSPCLQRGCVDNMNAQRAGHSRLAHLHRDVYFGHHDDFADAVQTERRCEETSQSRFIERFATFRYVALDGDLRRPSPRDDIYSSSRRIGPGPKYRPPVSTQRFLDEPTQVFSGPQLDLHQGSLLRFSRGALFDCWRSQSRFGPIGPIQYYSRRRGRRRRGLSNGRRGRGSAIGTRSMSIVQSAGTILCGRGPRLRLNGTSNLISTV